MLRSIKKRQTGVTLFEVLLVLFVAAFITAAVATIYSKVTMTYKANSLLTDVQQLTANITTAYGTSGAANYSGISLENLYNAGLVPTNMCTSGCGTTINPWNTTDGWTLTGVSSGGGEEGGTSGGAQSYELTLEGIPAAACASLFNSFMAMSTAAPLQVEGNVVASAADGIAYCSSASTVSMSLFVL